MKRFLAIAAALTACTGGKATAPGTWTLDITPFPSTLEVGEKIAVHVIAMDASATTRFDVSNVQVTSSNLSALRVSGDTIIALGMARVNLNLRGSLDAHTVFGQRTIIVLPAPTRAN